MSAPSPWDTMSDEEILAATYCRVMPSSDVLPRMSYAWEIAPDIAVAFNLDLPESVLYLTDDEVGRFGLDALLDAGLANLRSLELEAHEVLAHDDARVEVVLGESMFTASRLLVLDDVVARLGLHVDPDLGVFVAAPYRHQLDLHVVRDVTAVPSLQLLAGFAHAGFGDSAGPVSPSVYWWRPHAIERVSTVDDDGVRIEVGPELGELLNRLAHEK
jgi:hypothetical protein